MFLRIKNFVLPLFFVFGLLFFVRAEAATNISPSPSEHWAWNDIVGWIDFYNTDSITVASNATTTGYASSSVGDISLDCATTRGDINICAQSDYGAYNDGAGNLSGWAWSDTYGWISFWCGNHDPGCTPNYGVIIDPNTGTFSRFAWNDAIGWISFNCADPNPPSGICGQSDYKVVTTWRATSKSAYLDSSTFDTGVPGGAQLNSVIWYGNQPVGTSVGFQLAASTSSIGPWNFVGSDGTASTHYMTGPGISRRFDYSLHAGKRYFRYRVTLFSDEAQSLSPRIDDIFVNWSP